MSFDALSRRNAVPQDEPLTPGSRLHLVDLDAGHAPPDFATRPSRARAARVVSRAWPQQRDPPVHDLPPRPTHPPRRCPIPLGTALGAITGRQGASEASEPTFCVGHADDDCPAAETTGRGTGRGPRDRIGSRSVSRSTFQSLVVGAPARTGRDWSAFSGSLVGDDLDADRSRASNDAVDHRSSQEFGPAGASGRAQHDLGGVLRPCEVDKCRRDVAIEDVANIRHPDLRGGDGTVQRCTGEGFAGPPVPRRGRREPSSP
jgi:hypothetical protein